MGRYKNCCIFCHCVDVQGIRVKPRKGPSYWVCAECWKRLKYGVEV